MKYLAKSKNENNPDVYFETRLEAEDYIDNANKLGLRYEPITYEISDPSQTAKPKYILRSKTRPDKIFDTKVEAEYWRDNYSYGIDFELIEELETITATDCGTPGGDKTVTVTAKKNGDEIKVIDLKIEEPDMVNHPPHYANKNPETIEMIRAVLTKKEFIGYCKGQILKYRDRAHDKGNLEQDMAKAKFYYDLLMEVSNEQLPE